MAQQHDSSEHNPYTTPVHVEGPELDTNQDFTDLVRTHKRMNRNSFLFGVPGIALQMASNALEGPLAVAAGIGGIGLMIVGFSFYARMRGRSGWFGLFGIAGLLGLLALIFVSKRCLECGGKIKSKRCTQCGAPGPP